MNKKEEIQIVPSTLIEDLIEDGHFSPDLVKILRASPYKHIKDLTSGGAFGILSIVLDEKIGRVSNALWEVRNFMKYEELEFDISKDIGGLDEVDASEVFSIEVLHVENLTTDFTQDQIRMLIHAGFTNIYGIAANTAMYFVTKMSRKKYTTSYSQLKEILRAVEMTLSTYGLHWSMTSEEIQEKQGYDF